MSNPVRIVDVAVGILVKPDGQFLLGSRPAGKPFAGFWEFPGGKLEAGETALAALARELFEEMGITVTAAHPWLTQTFTYPHATVRLHFFCVTAWQGDIQSREGQQFAWQANRALTVSPILPANGPIMRGLQLPATLALSAVALLGPETWLARLEQALANGLRWLILREPQLDGTAYAALAREVLQRVRAHHAQVFLHDQIDLARELGADGVHLSARTAATLNARPRGLDWVGASVHNATELAQAQRIGVDYAIAGHVKETTSHPGAAPLGWTSFAALTGQGWPFPLYAIGGLSPADVAQAQTHGAHGVALLSGAWQ
ncbi:8-oxo-dGTP diphosphatase [Silvimonas terrae]|uniref:8-oxo-dGTP diphosphatase n=1 Tax=Silvimonas terrae TaxID=300266 RepID=A0A840RFQ1_9NEIS|nr:Nudix family hydrolase [Silvimonas terrae]MBB5191348.1 8-oxo-dGTP diphosphatase [Silvimonas terrae]